MERPSTVAVSVNFLFWVHVLNWFRKLQIPVSLDNWPPSRDTHELSSSCREKGWVWEEKGNKGSMSEKSAAEPQHAKEVTTLSPRRESTSGLCVKWTYHETWVLRYSFSSVFFRLPVCSFCLCGNPEGRWADWLCCDSVPFYTGNSSVSSLFREKSRAWHYNRPP